VPYREIVGSLLWISLCIMGSDLLRVKDLARRSNDYSRHDYDEAVKLLDRMFNRRDFGIIYIGEAVLIKYLLLVHLVSREV
jgi:hypothetical protein